MDHASLRDEIFNRPPARPNLGTPVRVVLSRLAALVIISALMGAATILTPTLLTGVAASTVYAGWEELPSDFDIDVELPARTTLLTADGEELATVAAVNRVPLTRDDIPDSVVEALIATEDADFYDHQGIDLEGIGRAALTNIANSGRDQGGSTITQQLVKNLALIRAEDAEETEAAQARGLADKIQEAKYSIGVEDANTKDEILTAYLNTMYFGTGTYGLAAAASAYFGAAAADLDVPQAATLVGLLKSPTNYDPVADPDSAKARRDTVLWRMKQEGFITQAEHDEYVEADIDLELTGFNQGCANSDYPYYCAHVLDEVLNDPSFGDTREDREQFLHYGEVTITTGATTQALDAAQQAVDDTLGADNEYKAGLATVEPGTGHLLAIAQNTDWEDTQIVLADSAQQTGSAFKPVTLAAAFDQGIDPSWRASGVSPYFSSLDNPPSGFKNSEGGRGGMMDARGATRISNNVYYVRLTERTGVRNVAAMANRLGLNLPTDLTGREASITLGSYESSPIELAGAYATFASGGTHCRPVAVTGVVDERSGEDLPVPDAKCDRVLTGAVAGEVQSLLTEPMKDGGTADGLSIGRPMAAKTGSTNDWAIAWFAGYTPSHATALWVADPDGPNSNPLRNVRMGNEVLPYGYGGVVAAPIWQQMMADAHDGMAKDKLANVSSPRIAPDRELGAELRGLDLAAVASVAAEHGWHVMVEPVMADSPGFGPDAVVRGDLTDDDVLLVTMSRGSDISGISGQELTPTPGGELLSGSADDDENVDGAADSDDI